MSSSAACKGVPLVQRIFPQAVKLCPDTKLPLRTATPWPRPPRPKNNQPPLLPTPAQRGVGLHQRGRLLLLALRRLQLRVIQVCIGGEHLGIAGVSAGVAQSRQPYRVRRRDHQRRLLLPPLPRFLIAELTSRRRPSARSGSSSGSPAASPTPGPAKDCSCCGCAPRRK